MSTRSLIAMKELPDEKGKESVLKVIYCHWDGYPSHNGRILLEHYKTPEKVRALMNLGDLSSLASEIGEKHDFDAPFEKQPHDMCMAYGRDRGEKDIQARTYKMKKGELPEDFKKDIADSWCEYLYLFDEKTKRWSFSPIDGKRVYLTRLTKKICKED